MKGALPKPDIVKIAQGTYRKCRAKKNKPQSKGKPKSPFKKGTIAYRKWVEVTSGLTRLGLIDEIDSTHIEGLCKQYEIAKQADELVAQQGMVIDGAMGGKVKNPAINISDAAWGKVRSYCNDLGLNHLSRQRMESNAPEEQEEIAEKYLA